MTLPVWPASLPAPTRDSYGYALPELNQRTPFPVGARVRPLFRDDSDDFNSISAIFTGPQCKLFKGWLRYEAANGAGWFSVSLRVDDEFEPCEARFTGPPTFSLISYGEWRVTLPLETRIGTTISREAYEDILDGIGFSDYIKTLLIPSDTAIILPITGDDAPSVPIPWLGLYLPFGARIALEGADGGVAPLDLPPDTVFTGMVPRRLLARGTDADAVVYGLTHPTVTSLPDYSGDRVLHVVLSDTVDFVGPAVGGIYSAGGGAFRYLTAAGTADATIAPKTWLADPAAVITRINATGTGAEFSALAFVRARSIPLAPLMFGDDGEALQFTNDGSPLAFGS